jgi:hypothetical protein
MARKPPQYENSPADRAEDARGAGLLGITPKQYEKMPHDTIQDIAGQRRLNAAMGTKALASAVVANHRGGPRKR